MSAPAPASQAPSDERWHPGAEIVRLQRRVVDQMSKLEVSTHSLIHACINSLLSQSGGPADPVECCLARMPMMTVYT